MSPHRELLQEARKLIDDETSALICFAMMDASERHPHLYDACIDLCEHIQAQLGGASSLSSWLLHRGIRATPDQRRLARLAWIDKLLESYL